MYTVSDTIDRHLREAEDALTKALRLVTIDTDGEDFEWRRTRLEALREEVNELRDSRPVF